MPKIGKMTFYFKNVAKTFDVYYSRSAGFYIPTFPPEVVQFVQQADSKFNINGGNTEEELKSKLTEAITRYYELTATEKRVIVIRVSLPTAFVMNKLKSGGYVGYQEWVKPVIDKVTEVGFGSLSAGLGFEYNTGVIISGNEEKFYQTTQDENGDILTREEYGRKIEKRSIVIPYSIEAERFFENLRTQLFILGKSLIEFVTDSNRLTEQINNFSKNKISWNEKNIPRLNG